MRPVATALLAILATGCFFKPEPPAARAVDDGGPSGTGDGSGSSGGGDGPPGTCTLHDDFNASAADCGAWATKTVTGAATVVHGPGTLKMTGAGSVVCESMESVDILGGARVEVKVPVRELYGSVSFEVIDVFTSTVVALRIEGKGTTNQPVAMLKSPNGTFTAQTPFVPSQMAVWQLRREEQLFAGGAAIGSTDIVLEYSVDGTSWTELGRHGAGTVKFTAAKVRLVAQLPSAAGAELDNLDACP